MPVKAGPDAVSVVLPVRNGAATIEQQLAALAGQTYGGPWEVVVADNGSADATPRIARTWAGRIPRLTVVEAGDHAGVGYARNVGCAAATGQLLLFCDADDVVGADWVAEMAAGLGRYAAVGGRIERGLLSDPDAVAARPGRPDGLLDSFGYLRYPLTANSGIRRAAWSQVGGFDESYSYGSGDVVFYWRVQLAGFTLGYLPKAVVHYRLRHGRWQMARQYYQYGTSHPQLFRDFARSGMPRSDTGGALRDWGRLACRLCRPGGSRSDRSAWVTQAAMRAGRLLGSARNRVLYL